MFIIRRCDRDILVLSAKYIDEVVTLQANKLSAIDAHIQVSVEDRNNN